MRIEIDQSGKLEDTNKPTVVGFSNKMSGTVIIRSIEKQRLQKYFRKIGKPQQYIYRTFAVLIYCLLKDNNKISQVIIDREYPGQESLIKSFLLERLNKDKIIIDKKSISFDEIGKSAKIHGIVWSAYINKKADLKLSARDVLKYLH